MKNLNNLSNKVINEIYRDGYSIVKNVLNKKKCNDIIKHLDKLEDKEANNKYHTDERSKFGQVVIRDLVLRSPKHFLKLIDNNLIIKVLNKVFKEPSILDNCMASKTTNVNKNYFGLVHIDSHLPSYSNENTSDIVACYCLDDFTKENGATKVWPKSHLSGIRIQNSKNYSNLIKKKNKYVEAKKGSIIFFLGQTWHQIGKNINNQRRWGILCHYKRWWIKPSTEWTKCGPSIYKLLNNKQKELFGFNSISPEFNLKKQYKNLKTLRKSSKLSKNYFKVIQY